MGTPSFMSPEQARGRWEEVDARSDLWSLGATMFTLLTSRFVHEAETPNEALVLAVTARARSVATLVPELRSEAVELVDKSLEYEKEGRFQTAKEMQEAVRGAYTSLQGPARVPQVSAPDIAPESHVSIVDSGAAATPSVSSTGPGTAASVVSSQGPMPPAREPDPSQRPLIFAGIAGAALVVVGLALLLRGGHDADQTPSTAAPSTAATAPAPTEGTKPQPQVTPVEEPREATPKTRAVSVDSLPLDKAADDAPKPAPAASAKPDPKKATSPENAANAPAAKPAAPPPAWLEAAQAQPQPAKPAAPPPAPPAPVKKAPGGGDPFSKRF